MDVTVLQITLDTKDVFIEATATDLTKAKVGSCSAVELKQANRMVSFSAA